MFEKITSSNLNNVVFNALKEKIINNELKPGEKLDPEELSGQLGVSRTPITNALKALEQKGYVVVYPRSGSYVRKYSVEEIEAIFDFRAALESLSVKRAFRTPDKTFLLYYKEKFQYIISHHHDDTNGKWVETFFTVETAFHGALIRTCPQIIADELQNLIDLTKRMRKLHLKYYSMKAASKLFRQNEVQLHINLIDALLNNDTSTAEAIIRLDIESTKQEILENYIEIEKEA